MLGLVWLPKFLKISFVFSRRRKKNHTGLEQLESESILTEVSFLDVQSLKGTLRLFGTLAYSPYPPELDKSMHTFFISVHARSLFDAPTASLA